VESSLQTYNSDQHESEYPRVMIIDLVSNLCIQSKYDVFHLLEHALAVWAFNGHRPFGARCVGCSIDDSRRCPNIEVRGGGVGFEPVDKFESWSVDRPGPCRQEAVVARNAVSTAREARHDTCGRYGM
jgi:hypothetical protein